VKGGILVVARAAPSEQFFPYCAYISRSDHRYGKNALCLGSAGLMLFLAENFRRVPYRKGYGMQQWLVTEQTYSSI
jgi:hypothetical protein